VVPYNPLFERFYDQDEDQVRGLIAYGLYKVAKREWSTQFVNNAQRQPTLEEIHAYHATWRDSVILGKRAEADDILESYANEIVKQERPGIIEEALRGTFWSSVLTNIVSGALYTLLLIAIIVIVRWAGVDLLSLAGTTR